MTWSKRLAATILLAGCLPACRGDAPESPAAAPTEPAVAAEPAAGEFFPESDDPYVAGIEAFRADRARRLAEPGGWTSLIGLYWLEVGDNGVGSEPTNVVLLPADAAPPSAGRLVYDGATVRLIADRSAGITLEGEPVLDRELADDASGGPPDVLELGRLTFHVIRRGDRHGIRVKDPESPARTQFAGLVHFPVDPAFHFEARLDAFDEPLQYDVETVIDEPAKMYSPGFVEFEFEGQTHRLRALASQPEATRLFLIFKDQTSGRETYGAGRYLYAERDGERVDLDFNRAYNPPCVFTTYATCPLPPPENRLPIPIVAGEKSYEHRTEG